VIVSEGHRKQIAALGEELEKLTLIPEHEGVEAVKSFFLVPSDVMHLYMVYDTAKKTFSLYGPEWFGGEISRSDRLDTRNGGHTRLPGDPHPRRKEA
jgi:hypothetical protein